MLCRSPLHGYLVNYRHMTVVKFILRGVRNLSVSEQVKVARYVHQLNANVQQDRDEVRRLTHGLLDEADGEAFEQAMKNARRLPEHG